MFSTIDSFLITCTQWFVRQLELYTPIERMDLSNFCLLLYKNSLLAMAVLIPLAIFLEHAWHFIYVALIITFSLEYHRYRAIILKQKTEDSSLPQEIITRETIRQLLIFSSLLSGIVVLPLLILKVLSTGTCTISDLLVAFTWGVFIIKLSLELILCTTSLPPGEKERRTKEKEMRKMQPALIQN